jgi:hypothetical protein
MTRIAPILLALLILAGCGGDETSASESYANDVCSSLSTWVTDVQETVQSVTDKGLGVRRDDIQSAFDQTKEATDTLANDLEQAGPPETEDGQEAMRLLDGLATQLQQQLDVIEQAIDSGGGLTTIGATLASAVSAAATAVDTTFQNLQDLDAPGELRDAFENSDECNSLSDQLAEIRSQ